ncbi:MAG: hypothetical protein IJK31_05280 [Ruminococcus sp.]|nr:hypothetical protein [Ruminococcus sp.]HRR76569.1 hypothetical protein [Ruminococcus sp.]
MKKLLATLCALTLTLSLAACGDKDSSSEKNSSKSSSASSKDESSSNITPEQEAEVFEEIARTYTVSGYTSSGDVPEKFKDMEKYKDKLNEEGGVTITKDGVLHIDGEEYQLTAQKVEYNPKYEYEGKTITCGVTGCDFSLKGFEHNINTVSKDYEGYAALNYWEFPSYTEYDGRDNCGTTGIQLFYSPKGSSLTTISLMLSCDYVKTIDLDPLTDEIKADAFQCLAGEYTYRSGYFEDESCSIKRYADPSSDEVKKIFKDDPVTISEDGVLHFDGKDYQLEYQIFKTDEAIFCVEGNGCSAIRDGFGFDGVGAKDYSGVVFIESSDFDIDYDGDKITIEAIEINIKDDNSEESCLTLNFDHVIN